MNDTTPRLRLPLLAAGQAQKEIAHNEALVLLDQLTMPVVEAMGVTTPPIAPVPGQAWIVGAAPGGAWAGQADALAIWSEGGWRFVTAIEGMRAWVRGDGLAARRGPLAWVTGPAIAAPAGGAIADTQCRAAVAAILGALRTHGLIAA